jgi:hypothetical protein
MAYISAFSFPSGDQYRIAWNSRNSRPSWAHRLESDDYIEYQDRDENRVPLSLALLVLTTLRLVVRSSEAPTQAPGIPGSA